jgi:tetratricopeptide (TPR) repeat protein
MRCYFMKRHLLFVTALGICFFAVNTTTHAQQVKADTGGVAIGGSVTGSTINIGVPPEQLAALVRQAADFSETQKKLIAKLEGDLDLNQRQIRTALSILGENDIPPERLAAKLVEIAERFKDLQGTASAQPGDDPKIAALKIDARKAIEAGELAKADALLGDVETEQRRALDRLAVNAAETSAQRGEIALTRLRYAAAAKHFANAAAVFPPNSAHEDKRIDYLAQEAAALLLQGSEFGNNDALRSAIERGTRLIDLNPRERVPLKWAESQNNLGFALLRLGEREAGIAKLEEAVLAFREALKERTRERVPFQWAQSQNNLAFALLRLGEREAGIAKLEEAVLAFREALKERTRERVPLAWAATQSDLATALTSLGLRERGTAKLEEAITIYREALKEVTRERAPLDWALLQNNIGAVLFYLGARTRETAKSEEAAIAFREALKERTRERVPLDWAATQQNLGNTLTLLGGRERGTAKLEEAVTASREALKELTRERVPLQWATIQHNVGGILAVIGERESGITRLEEAIAVLREALEERTRERVPLDWAASLGTQGMVLMVIAERRGDASIAESALDQINTAFETMRDSGDLSKAALFEQQVLPKARALVTRLREQ